MFLKLNQYPLKNAMETESERRKGFLKESDAIVVIEQN